MTNEIEGLERRFHQEMLGIYQNGLQLKPPYRATRFLQMVQEQGGRQTADKLLATDAPSEGFTELFLRGNRLDLSVEYLVLKEPWRSLFSPDQLTVARERLRTYEFSPPPDDRS